MNYAITHIAKKLKAARQAKGLSQRELGDEIGVHPNTVYRWIQRERDLEQPDKCPRPASRTQCASLVPVRMVEEAVAQPPASIVDRPRLELVVKGVLGDRDVTVRLPHGFDQGDLRAALSALADSIC